MCVIKCADETCCSYPSQESTGGRAWDWLYGLVQPSTRELKAAVKRYQWAKNMQAGGMSDSRSVDYLAMQRALDGIGSLGRAMARGCTHFSKVMIETCPAIPAAYQQIQRPAVEFEGQLRVWQKPRMLQTVDSGSHHYKIYRNKPDFQYYRARCRPQGETQLARSAFSRH